ncbi:MAG: ABC transporter ATP-binding protein [Candidatus Rokubacteria bacterium]|nr:ABC transporter ATP-binding protein [Candidatus Rokubacteria bacterium]
MSKRFGATIALDHVSLDVARGEFVSLLGPSGCGKTTALRVTAGLTHPDTGDVWLAGERVTMVPAARRNIGMVFQTWALFPNMTAAENIAFPFRVRRMPRRQIVERTAEIVALVGLQGLEARYPHELSGGQQQRVGLGRALARDPAVLLLDEPFSALDAPLRRSLLLELRRLQQKLGVTTVYVTHDQEEALSASDRVAVMDRGRILAVDTPDRLYLEPTSTFVASFIGALNILVGEVAPDGRTVACGPLTVPVSDLNGARPGERVRVGVRPEDIRLVRPSEGGHVRGRIVMRSFQGVISRLEVECGDLRLHVDVRSVDARDLAPPREVALSVPLPGRVLERLNRPARA